MATRMKMFSFYADPKDIETWKKAAAAESKRMGVKITLAEWCRFWLKKAAKERKK